MLTEQSGFHTQHADTALCKRMPIVLGFPEWLRELELFFQPNSTGTKC